MSEDLNKTIIIGRLTRDVEKIETAGGVCLVKGSIACNKRVKKQEEWKDEGHFFDFIYWGKRAEGLSPYLLKGQQIAIDGRINQNRWKNDAGENRSKIEIEANSIQLMGGRQENQEQSTPAPDPQGFYPAFKAPSQAEKANDPLPDVVF